MLHKNCCKLTFLNTVGMAVNELMVGLKFQASFSVIEIFRRQTKNIISVFGDRCW